MGDIFVEGKPFDSKDDCSGVLLDGKNDSGDHGETKDNLVIDSRSSVHPFSKKTWKDDLTLVVGEVEEECLYVTKSVLAMFSKVFNTRFEERSIDVMELSGKSSESVVEFLCCLYPNIRKPVTIENVRLVMPLALEYECDELIAECETCIRNNVTKAVPGDILVSLAEVCKAHQQNILEDLCWKAIEEKDIQEIEELESKSEEAAVSGRVAAMKVEKLKRMLRQYKELSEELRKERDSLEGNLLFLMGDMGPSTRDQFISVMWGDYNKISVTAKNVYLDWQISDQTNNRYKLIMTQGALYMEGLTQTVFYTIKFSLTSECSCTIKGRLVIVNRVNRNRNRSFPFYGRFSKSVREIIITKMRSDEITNENNGFLVESEAMIEIEYLSRTAVLGN